MIIDSDFLNDVRTTVKALYFQAQAESPNQWTKFAGLVPVETNRVTLTGFGSPPIMRPMRDVVQFGKTFINNLTVDVGENAVGIEIKEQTLMSDPMGMVLGYVRDFFTAQALYEEKVSMEKLSDGFATTNGAAFDGKAFYADNHTYGDSATHDNKIATVLAADGVAYSALWTVINTAEGEHGEPLGLVPTVLVVHSANRLLARQMLNGTITTGGISNVLNGDVELVVTPFLKTATEYHLLAGGGAIKPILLLEQMPKRFSAMDDPNAEPFFSKKIIQYQVDNKLAVAYEDPRKAAGSTGA